MKKIDIECYKLLTQSEKHTYQCIETMEANICTKSLVELAEYCKVSTATVSRTLRKMGYKNIKEYKRQFEYRNKEINLSDFDNHLVDLILNFPNSKIKEIKEQIITSDELYIVAFGPTSSIALEFTLNLIQLGYKAECINDSEHFKQVTNTKRTHDKLFILISYKGEDVDMIQETEKTKSSNRVFLITSCPSSTLSYYCHNVLSTNSVAYDPRFKNRITLNILTSKIIRALDTSSER